MLLIVALSAVGLGHGLVWVLSTNGIVRGEYGAYRHEAIVQSALSVAIVVAIATIVALGECIVAPDHKDWLATTADRIAAISPIRIFAAVYCLQLAALFVLETVEQTAQFGHSLGLTSALGAPLLVGLIVHAACAFGVSMFALLAMRALAAARVRLRGVVAPFVRRLAAAMGKPESPAAQTLRAIKRISTPTPLARKIANRPPPSASPA